MKDRTSFKNQKGQALMEYLILVCLMGVACIGMVRLLQNTLNVNFANAVNSLQGIRSKVSYEKIEDSDTKKKDFSDFMRGSSKGKSGTGSDSGSAD